MPTLTPGRRCEDIPDLTIFVRCLICAEEKLGWWAREVLAPATENWVAARPNAATATAAPVSGIHARRLTLPRTKAARAYPQASYIGHKVGGSLYGGDGSKRLRELTRSE